MIRLGPNSVYDNLLALEMEAGSLGWTAKKSIKSPFERPQCVHSELFAQALPLTLPVLSTTYSYQLYLDQQRRKQVKSSKIKALFYLI